jgi:MerR family transcriptional regulator, light-induced transcriptional regulator
MGNFSIKELEQLSGIKAHTIRIWEKRHRLIVPKRTATNIRYYSDDDLKKIINVSLLNNRGVKISKIVTLSEQEISRQIFELSEDKTDVEIYIDQLVLAMIDLEEEQFEKVLSRLTLKLGFENAILDVVYPFLEKIGILWLTENISPAQEHFITHLIRQKIIVAIDALQVPSKLSKRAILFLPENEQHEIGLLFYHYIVRLSGVRTYYLGQSVPYRDLKSIGEIHKPDFIITSFTSSPQPRHVQSYLDQLCGDFKVSKIFASGAILKRLPIKKPANLTVFENAKGLKTALNGHQ